MKKLTTSFLAFAVLAANISFAQDNDEIRASFNFKPSTNQCAVLLTECIAFDDQDKTSCIKESADNIFCRGTELGKLAKKRWVFLAANTASLEDLNPQREVNLTDKVCMDNFDNLFSAKLLQGGMSKADINQLFEILNGCEIKDQIELNRQ